MKRLVEQLKWTLVAQLMLASSVIAAPQGYALETRKLLDDDPSANDWFGRWVAIEGDTAVVAAVNDDGPPSNSGVVHVFDARTGELRHELVAQDAGENERFGSAVSMSAGRVLIGSYRDTQAGSNSGSVYLFDAQSGAQLHKILADDAAPEARFGVGAAITGDFIIVGADRHSGAGTAAGKAYVYDANSGLKLRELAPSTLSQGDQFGLRMDASGDLVAISSKNDVVNGVSSGSVTVFDVTTGAELHRLHPSSPDNGDLFGEWVAIDGTRVVVGATGDDDQGTDSGAAYVFELAGAPLDVQPTYKLLLPPGIGGAGNHAGLGVSISGDRVALGAHLADPFGTNTGTVYLYDFVTGAFEQYLRPTDPQPGDNFGHAVALDGDLAVVGAYLDFGNDRGSAYLYDLEFAGTPKRRHVISREFSVAAGPDLRYDVAATVVPAEGDVESLFSIRWRVENIGSEEAVGPWVDRVEFDSPIAPQAGAAGLVFDLLSPASLAPGASYELQRVFRMPATPGAFTVALHCDALNELRELDNFNNELGPLQIQAIEIPRPDLRAQISAATSGSVFAGGTASVSFKVWNEGQASTPVQPWMDSIWLLEDVDGDHVPPTDLADAVHSWSFNNLLFLEPGDGSQAGTFYERPGEVLGIPAGLSGHYFLAVEADRFGQQAEQSEQNNVYIHPVGFDVLEPPRPDLGVGIVGVQGVTPGTKFPSGSFQTLVWEVESHGPAVFGGQSVITQIWASDNSDDSSPSALDGDTLLAQFTDNVPPMNVGDTAQRSREIFLPFDTAELPGGGPYFFKVRLDPGDSLPEEEVVGSGPYWNNLGSSGNYLITLAPTPDFLPMFVGPFTGQQSIQVGFPLRVDWMVSDPHDEVLAVPLTWRDGIWLSPGNAVLGDADDLLVGYFTESTTDIGGAFEVPASYPKSTTKLLPEDFPEGTCYLILKVDEADDVFEFDSGHDAEANNGLVSAPFQVERHPADLQVFASIAHGAIVPPSEGAPGETIELPWTVLNDLGAGLTNKETWVDRVYLSESSTTHEGGHLLLSRVHSGVLVPGASYEELREVTVPYDTPGPWFLHFRTDHFESLFEDDISQNVAVVPFSITENVADLVVDQVSAVQQMEPGEPVFVDWVVRNAGGAATSTTSWSDRVFLADAPDLASASTIHTLGAWYHSAPLGQGSSYSASASFLIPQTQQGIEPGAWYVVVQADGSGSVFELNNTNNDTATRTLVQVDAPPADSGGGGSGTTWVPSNLVPFELSVAETSVVAGQPLHVSWRVRNDGEGATDLASWADSVYLSQDGDVDPVDTEYLGFYSHGTFLDAGESTGVVTREFIVPLDTSPGFWALLLDADGQNQVYQGGAYDDDFLGTVNLIEVLPAPLTNLEVSDSVLPTDVLMGERFDFSWTTLNDSARDIPGSWGWTDRFWLVPDGETFPSTGAKFLGDISSNAGRIPGLGGTHTQSSTVATPRPTVPGIPPGAYRLAIISDALGQISETDEGNNVFTSASTVQISAIELLASPATGGFVDADIPSGEARWFELRAPSGESFEDHTVDVLLEHSDPNARCELYVREGLPPTIGAYDLVSEGVATLEPFKQSVRIPRTSSGTYYIMARTVSGAGVSTSAHIEVQPKEFLVNDVQPPRVGAGPVTLAVEGFELWRASAVELVEVGSQAPVASALELELLDSGVLLARFDLSGISPMDVEVRATDGAASLTVTWLGTLAIDPPLPLSVTAELALAPSIRRGESATGELRLLNTGNVDVPFSLVSVGYPHLAGSAGASGRIALASEALGVEQIDSDGSSEFWSLLMEDLAPGRDHVLEVQLAVGADYADPDADIGVACIPASREDLTRGPLGVLSEELRLALASNGGTPAALSAVAQDQGAWEALVAQALVSGSLNLDHGSLHVPETPWRTTRDLLEELGAGVAVELAISTPGAIPPSAIDQAAGASACFPFADQDFPCEELFPAECGGGAATVSVTTQLGGNVPVGVVCVGTPAPDDPNEKLKPQGVGPTALVSPAQPLRYEVHFENQVGATAWASLVQIRDPLEPGFESSSVRFEELRIGQTTLQFPPNSLSYVDQVMLQIDEETEVLAQISALVDAETDTIIVTLQALDPSTGLPNAAGDRGLLPPNEPGLEQLATGYVAFSVEARELPTAPGGPMPEFQQLSGQRRRNSSEIRFNANAPIATNTTENMLDGGVPTSQLTVGPTSGQNIPLSWSADDTEDTQSGEFPGAGVRAYSLYVRKGASDPWEAVVTDYQARELNFRGEQGERYEFKLEAVDFVGNREVKSTPDASVELAMDCNLNGIPDEDDILAGTSQDCDSSGVPDSCEIAEGTHSDVNGNGVPDTCECSVMSYCASSVNSTGDETHLFGLGVPSLSANDFSLLIHGAPPQQPGLFVYSLTTKSTPYGGGILCVGSPVVRLSPALQSSSAGTNSYQVDFSSGPLGGGGADSVIVGDTRYFQYWYRDPVHIGGTGFNLSDGLQVTFCE